MGIHVIKMPDIGEGIAEVELVAWHVKAGDAVKEDQILADVMTDKATVEIPSPVAGIVVSLGGAVGQVIAVGAEAVRIEVEGSGNASEPAKPPQATAEGAGGGRLPPAEPDLPDPKTVAVLSAAAPLPAPGGAPAPVSPPSNAASTTSARAPSASPPSSAGSTTRPSGMPIAPVAATRAAGDKPIASPAVRRRAWDLGIELNFVQGSGNAGRIVDADLGRFLESRGGGEATAAPTASSAYAPRDGEEAIPVIGLRRKIAQKMQDAKRRIPHFSYVEEIDVTELEALRMRLNAKWGAARGKLTVLPFLVRAIVLAVRDIPQVNARYDDDAGVVTRHAAVHLGVATQTDGGLVVPVMRHAETLDLWAAAKGIARLADAARGNKATRDELSGSTITLTSLGALGGIVSTPVINHPEVAIVGVNRIVERPMIVGGAIVARKTMNLSSSFDHRVVDGMDAAQFIQAIRALLETPAMLFVE